MKKYIRFVGAALVLAAVSVVTAGCSKKSASSAGAQVSARPKRVVTTFTILQDIAQNIGGDKILVESITKPGAEIHEYEPTPLDVVKAQSADLVLRNGFGLERWFEKFMGSVKNVPSVNLSDGIEPLGIGEGPYDGMPNPHSWMSPKNALIYVENIRKAFAELDPANAKTYDANAASYSESIKKVDAFMAEKLLEIPAEQRWLVTCEGAFSYLIRDYDMKELYLWPVNADEEGSPRQIQKVVDTIRKNKIPVAFSESTISNKPQLQVCKETGAHYGGVLYVDSLTYEDGDAPTYLKMLEYNANTIVKGFEGNL
ncbi:metal ABC transporter substrate-binding protein [Treponema parvum]|uniref:metal ABC transporter substrate-binding protein n=1 Tax=Treponema parvum TaxID=138851 RepID=UPI001AEBB8EE|nr:metal ABC transporter substrate-binding protein [Treponema parvum]QTQ16915.1 metal ABC transporter substrate-binding protein [Treponema parvum]